MPKQHGRFFPPTLHTLFLRSRAMGFLLPPLRVLAALRGALPETVLPDLALALRSPRCLLLSRHLFLSFQFKNRSTAPLIVFARRASARLHGPRRCALPTSPFARPPKYPSVLASSPARNLLSLVDALPEGACSSRVLVATRSRFLGEWCL